MNSDHQETEWCLSRQRGTNRQFIHLRCPLQSLQSWAEKYVMGGVKCWPGEMGALCQNNGMTLVCVTEENILSRVGTELCVS